MPANDATLADGFNGGYFERIAYPNQIAEPDAVNGGPPYGATFPHWLEHSPTYNVSGLETPVRLEAYGVAGAIEEWEWFSLSSSMKKPIDLVLLPRGTHLLVKPWERMTSQQSNVDWFASWLKDETDPSPRLPFETRLPDSHTELPLGLRSELGALAPLW